jgi:hypothetical protein
MRRKRGCKEGSKGSQKERKKKEEVEGREGEIRTKNGNVSVFAGRKMCAGSTILARETLRSPVASL